MHPVESGKKNSYPNEFQNLQQETCDSCLNKRKQVCEHSNSIYATTGRHSGFRVVRRLEVHFEFDSVMLNGTFF